MDLNNIQLTPNIISDLYHSSLIESNSSETMIPRQSTPTPLQSEKFLGNNEKNILIVVHHTNIIHLSDEDLAFLTTILTACKFGLSDVVIVNTNNFPDYTYKEYINRFNSRVVLLFGIEPVSFGLPLDFPHFQVQSFAKQTFLYSPPLHEYDKLLKSKLWVCLKRIFNL